MEEKKNELISQSNALTSSRYDFSPTEKNVLYHIIQKVRHDYIEGTMQRDLWDNMYVQINAADLSRIADEDHTQRARKALRDLRHKDIEIEDEEGNWLTNHAPSGRVGQELHHLQSDGGHHPEVALQSAVL